MQKRIKSFLYISLGTSATILFGMEMNKNVLASSSKNSRQISELTITNSVRIPRLLLDESIVLQNFLQQQREGGGEVISLITRKQVDDLKDCFNENGEPNKEHLGNLTEKRLVQLSKLIAGLKIEKLKRPLITRFVELYTSKDFLLALIGTKSDDYLKCETIPAEFKRVIFSHVLELASLSKKFPQDNHFYDMGKELKQDQGINCVAFNHEDSLLGSGSDDHTIKLWNLLNGSCLQTLEGHKGSVLTLAFKKGEKGRYCASGADDHKVILWYWNYDGEDQDNNNITYKKQCKFKTDSAIQALAFHPPDGKHLVAGSSQGTLYGWDIETGKEMFKYALHQNVIKSLAFHSSVHHILASGSYDKTIKLCYDLFREKCSVETLVGHTQGVSALAFNGQYMASGSIDNTIKIWDIQHKKLAHTLLGHTDWVNTVAFYPINKEDVLLSGSDDQTIKVWDFNQGKCLHTLSSHTHGIQSICYNENGSLFVSGSKDNTLKIWGKKNLSDYLKQNLSSLKHALFFYAIMENIVTRDGTMPYEELLRNFHPQIRETLSYSSLPMQRKKSFLHLGKP
ncbi:MAG: WD40 repeat domain-containing protein [Candidatus Babeliaceae bacterium]